MVKVPFLEMILGWKGGLLHDRFSRIFYLHVDSNLIVTEIRRLG